MFGSEALEVAIGLALVFFVVATASSAVVDLITSAFKVRSSHLEKSVYRLLSGTKDEPKKLAGEAQDNADAAVAFVERIYKSSPVAGLAAAAKEKPSYMPAKSFASAVLSILQRDMDDVDGQVETDPAANVVALTTVLETLPNDLRDQLKEIARRTGEDIVAIQAGLEDWFDSAMDRASGVFKRWSQWVLIAVATVIIVAFNVDAIDIGTTLWTSEEVRTQVAVSAGLPLDENAEQPKTAGEAIDRAATVLAPFGWNEPICTVADGESCGPMDYVTGFVVVSTGHVLGWLITILLVSLGAPFWYDALSKLIAIRGSQTKPAKAAGEPGSAQSAMDADAARKPPKGSSDPIVSLANVLTPGVVTGD